jgi:hypothetical protein
MSSVHLRSYMPTAVRVGERPAYLTFARGAVGVPNRHHASSCPAKPFRLVYPAGRSSKPTDIRRS